MPKLKKSAKESICTPNSLVALSRRATTPSSRSRKVAQMISQPASTYSPWLAETIDTRPKNIASPVTMLGAA